MEKKDIKVDYDEEEDILHISKEGDRVKFSFDIELPNGDIVVDFGFDGKVVGLEFFDASGYFPFLKNVKGEKIKAKMSVQYGSKWAQIRYEIFTPKKHSIIQEIISPYNRNLILNH